MFRAKSQRPMQWRFLKSALQLLDRYRYYRTIIIIRWPSPEYCHGNGKGLAAGWADGAEILDHVGGN
jgi:hypothetical protein